MPVSAALVYPAACGVLSAGSQNFINAALIKEFVQLSAFVLFAGSSETIFIYQLGAAVRSGSCPRSELRRCAASKKSVS